jgi:hypothetical protein
MTEKYSVTDNFLSEEAHKKLHFNLLESMDFPWFLINGVLTEDDKDALNNYQLAHTFMDSSGKTSPFYNYVLPLIEAIDPNKIYKIKANLNPIYHLNVEHGYHVDYPDLHIKTAVYYVNSNNGYTKFENGPVIGSVENRLLAFDSQLMHTGSTCTDKNYRCVININYE